MPVSLSKGGNVSLSKEAPGLSNIVIGLGWDTRSTDGSDFDLDASMFVLKEDNKVRSDSDFIFYNNRTGADGAVEHLGDNLTGTGRTTPRSPATTSPRTPPPRRRWSSARCIAGVTSGSSRPSARASRAGSGRWRATTA
jgi:tellurium resistance protein TerD